MMPDSALPKYSLCFALVADGRRAEAREVLREMKELATRTYVKPYFLAMGHVALEEYDEAFKYFEQMFAERDPWITWFGTEPKLDVLRKDPRFIKLFRSTGNPFAFQQIESKEAENTSAEKSIAVLPLKLFNSSQSGKSDDDYLRVGLADAIVTRLSNVRRFIVRPTSSSLPFGKEDVDPFDAGRSLAVEYVVDGNLRRVNGRIRVTIQLLDVGKNSTCWSQSFDEKNTDVLELKTQFPQKSPNH
jgi:TolB-like protein